jgi:hypothetical protein
MRWFGVVALLFTLVGSSAAPAQSFGCAILNKEQARFVGEANKGQGRCEAQCTGCGCKGGPGYRALDGQCVGHANLNSKCGPPPHDSKGCVRECFVVLAACQLPPATAEGRPAGPVAPVAEVSAAAPVAPAATVVNRRRSEVLDYPGDVAARQLRLETTRSARKRSKAPAGVETEPGK